MNTYYCLYYRASNWNNTTGKKDPDTLRLSAIGLLAVLPASNILTVIAVISIMVHHTIVNKWVAGGIFVFFYILQLLAVSRSKSEIIRNEFAHLDENRKKYINKLFYTYLLLTFGLLVLVIAVTAVYKHKYGNYDEVSL